MHTSEPPVPRHGDAQSSADAATVGAPSDAPQAQERNGLLRALSPDAYAALRPHLEPVEITSGYVLWRPDQPIHGVYFPRTAVCSLLTPLADEAPVESATVGCEGMVGVP